MRVSGHCESFTRSVIDFVPRPIRSLIERGKRIISKLAAKIRGEKKEKIFFFSSSKSYFKHKLSRIDLALRDNYTGIEYSLGYYDHDTCNYALVRCIN